MANMSSSDNRSTTDSKPSQIRRAVLALSLMAAAAVVPTAKLLAGMDETKTWSGSFSVTLPPQGGIENGNGLLGGYASNKRWKVKLASDDNGDPEALRLLLPSPLPKKNETFDPIVPLIPQWYIYRFKYLDLDQEIRDKVPFRYVEVDWNTEGLPRGPGGSFTTPHFDFHFYTWSRDDVTQKIGCSSAGKTCDFTNSTTDAVVRFFDMPSACFLPYGYFPDVDSSIPEMGLHMLDSQFSFRVDNVNHNPVILYGTFDDRIVFLEVSLTLYAFEDAVKASNEGGRLSWPIRQPEKYQYEWWPKTVTLEYQPEENMFAFSYEDFEENSPSKSCDPS